MKLVRVLAVILGVLAALPALPAQAADAEKARAVVQTAVAEGVEAFTGKANSLDERARLLDGLLRRYSDPAMLTASVLGRHWAKQSPAEQAAFTDSFMRYLVSSYVGLLKNLQPGLKVEVGAAAESGPRVKVSSVVTLAGKPGEPIPVEWEFVEAEGGRLVLLDVTGEGISIIRAMRDDFASVLRSSGGKIDPLMEALARKIAENDQLNQTR